MSDEKKNPVVPFVPYDDDSAAYAAMLAQIARRNAHASAQANSSFSPPFLSTEESLPVQSPVLVSQAVIIPYGGTSDGQLIRAATLPLLEIIKLIMRDPTAIMKIDPRKWEEIIAGTYAASGYFDEVTLTPRSGDGGKDVLAVKKGFGSIRLIESIKRYAPDHLVKAAEARDLLGVLSGFQASKGILSTTSDFAPKIGEDPAVRQNVPYRLELVNGPALIERFKAYMKLK